MIERIHDVDGGTDGAAISHVIGDVIEMEKPVHEIAANAQFVVWGVGIAHGSEETRFETMKPTLDLLVEVTTAKEPLLALDSSSLLVLVHPKGKVTMRDQIRYDDLGRLCGVDGDRLLQHDGLARTVSRRDRKHERESNPI